MEYPAYVVDRTLACFSQCTSDGEVSETFGLGTDAFEQYISISERISIKDSTDFAKHTRCEYSKLCNETIYPKSFLTKSAVLTKHISLFLLGMPCTVG